MKKLMWIYLLIGIVHVRVLQILCGGYSYNNHKVKKEI